jgi:transposase
MSRGELTDEQWERLRPLLPPQKPKTGRPALDHRTILNGILWIDRTGAPWRDLPQRYGRWHTVASRFYRWRKAGIWQRLLQNIQQQADARGELGWDEHYIDSTIVRAHQHSAGARGGDPVAEALGRSQGGFSSKVHLRAEQGGKPMTLLVNPGQQHEAVMFEPLMEQGAVMRQGRGRPKLRPKRVVGDKGYSSRHTRRYLRQRGIKATIPYKSNERYGGRCDSRVYRERNLAERMINRLKQLRRVATRYEKSGENYLAMLTIAAILLWL